MYTFYVEADNTKVFKKLRDYGTLHLSEYETPYQKYLINYEIDVLENELQTFLQQIRRLNVKYDLKAYIKCAKKYKPFLLVNPSDELIYTTFFYKALNNPVPLGMDNEGYNLENLVINENSHGCKRGYYRCTKWDESHTEVKKEYIGEFQVSKQTTKQGATVHVFRRNYQRIKKEPSIYVLKAPSNQAVKDIETKEHYIRFTDDIIIHFAANHDIVEVYDKVEGKMRLTPFHTFNKQNNQLTKSEQEFLMAIQKYTESKSQKLDRKRA